LFHLCPLSFLFLQLHHAHHYLHSFPTRRSSDLTDASDADLTVSTPGIRPRRKGCRPATTTRRAPARTASRAMIFPNGPSPDWRRSEEHTSELQSRGHLVCRLLLEKKKTTTNLYD